MRYLIAVPFLSSGSGLSRYIFSLCKLLSIDNDIYVLTTHNAVDTSYERKELDSCGKNIVLISLGTKLKALKYLTALNWIRKIKPDIIVNNYNAVIQFIFPFISRTIKIVHVLHADVPDFYRIASINANCINAWVAPTIAIARHFNEYTKHKYPSKVIVIPHGVTGNNFSEHIIGHSIKIVFAGVLMNHKGANHLPAICQRMKEKGVNYHFTIIGDGILKEYLQQKFSNEIKTGQVVMTGVITHSQVYDIMRQSDVFLYPTNCDSFGLVIAEAMMNGAVPVVGLLEGITDNIILEGNNGFLVNPHNVESFAERISQLDKNHALLNKMRECAMQTARARFSESVMSANYRNFFNDIIEQTEK